MLLINKSYCVKVWTSSRSIRRADGMGRLTLARKPSVRTWLRLTMGRAAASGGFLPVGFWIADPEKLTFDRASSGDSFAPKCRR